MNKILNWLIIAVLCWVLLPEGARAAPGEPLWGKNLVHNPSFELGADTESGWAKRRSGVCAATASCISCG